MSKVSIVRCPDYNKKNVEDAVFRSVELIGGIENFVKAGDRVLIKPNLLSAKVPEEAVCTHPEVVRAVIRLVKKRGGRPLVGDSPRNFFTIKDVDLVYEKTGIKRVAEEECAELVKFDKVGRVGGYPVAQLALDASAIISLPKLKAHAFTVMTGAVKNTFGMVPGLFKVECHKSKPKPKDFVKILLDIFQITKPRLSVMDGILAMEGDGPASGDPREVGLVLASADAVSLDAVVSKLVGLPPEKDIIVNEARRRNAGEADMDNIELMGETIESAEIKDFKLPKTAHAINALPDFLAAMFARAIDFRPVIYEKLCEKCGVCKDSCPVDAITINEKASHIDNNICIKCFCCHEVCPYRSIYIKRNFIANLFWKD